MNKVSAAIVVLILSILSIEGKFYKNWVDPFPDGKYTYDPKILPTFPNTSVIPKTYPLFTQCDPIWGNDYMGGSSAPFDLVCTQGCAMSSVSMALNGKGYHFDSILPIYPGTLNAWLRYDQGYTCIDGDCDNLVLDKPNQISNGNITFISEAQKPSLLVLKAFVSNQNPVAVAHVRNDTHFVLIVGYDNVNQTTFYVNDPFYPSISYDYSEMTDLLLYSITQQPPLPPPSLFYTNKPAAIARPMNGLQQ